MHTDGSGIDDKIGEAAVIASQGIIRKYFLGSSQCFTVYSAELQGLAVALNIIVSQRSFQITNITIFMDNQGAVRSSEK